MMNEANSTIMTSKLVTVAPNDRLTAAKDIFQKSRIHHLPVVDGKKLVGIITTGDLVWLNKKFDEYDEILVKDVMTKRLATLEPDEKIGAAAEVLLEHLFHAVPITLDGDLVGIVTTFDILKYEFSKEYPPK